ncbi:MAG: recombinase family protein [Anaerolineales bacterium]|nr:MAG: recombinase family protein [Anaerolineales bacterium]
MKEFFLPPPNLRRPGSTVWAYLRDSGGAAQENSVPQQEAEVRAYCDRYKLALVEIFRDVAKSGGSVTGRDDFERMIDMSKIKDLRPDGLLIWNFARFTRDKDDSTFYKALLRKRGIVIHSMTDPIPDDDFGSRIVETVIDLSNEEKRRQTSRDVKRGLKALVSEGFSPGTPPKGYKRSAPIERGIKRDGKPRMVSKWERDPELWELVILAWTMRAEGRSLQEIQNATAGRLFTSPASWNGFFRSKTYLGIGVSGDLEVENHHEAAITRDVWEAVQKLNRENPMQQDHPRHPRRVGNPSLFTGFTYCLECGSMMTHTPGHKNKPWRYYMCGTKFRQGVKYCKSRRVGAQRSETAVLDAVINRVLTVDFFDQVIHVTRAKFSDTSATEKKIAALKERAVDLDVAFQRAMNAHEKTGSELALERMKQREGERAQVKAEIAHLESQIAASKLEIAPEAIQIAMNRWREQITEARKGDDIKFVRAWLYRFVSRIELGYNRAQIYYTYPMNDFSLADALFAFPLRGGTNNNPA